MSYNSYFLCKSVECITYKVRTGCCNSNEPFTSIDISLRRFSKLAPMQIYRYTKGISVQG